MPRYSYGPGPTIFLSVIVLIFAVPSLIILPIADSTLTLLGIDLALVFSLLWAFDDKITGLINDKIAKLQNSVNDESGAIKQARKPKEWLINCTRLYYISAGFLIVSLTAGLGQFNITVPAEIGNLVYAGYFVFVLAFLNTVRVLEFVSRPDGKFNPRVSKLIDVTLRYVIFATPILLLAISDYVSYVFLTTYFHLRAGGYVFSFGTEVFIGTIVLSIVASIWSAVAYGLLFFRLDGRPRGLPYAIFLTVIPWIFVAGVYLEASIK